MQQTIFNGYEELSFDSIADNLEVHWNTSSLASVPALCNRKPEWATIGCIWFMKPILCSNIDLSHFEGRGVALGSMITTCYRSKTVHYE